MAEIKLSRFKYTWQGAWNALDRYNPDDVVSYGGKVFVCLESHTSNPDFYVDLYYYNNDTPPLAVPKWELMTEGTSWKGNWSPDFYYKIGDQVKLGGTVYLCVNGHLSNSNYITNLEGEQVLSPTDPTGEKGFFTIESLANWIVQTSSRDWKIDWLADTYYKVDDVVRYGGRTYVCNNSHLSAGSVDAGLEANLADWDIINVADQWKGDWLVETKYILNDVVKFGGLVYRCIVPHKSAAAETVGLEADLGKWTVLHDGIEYKGDWTIDITYKVRDIVKYGSYTYMCNTFHTASAGFETAYFDIFCPGHEYDVVWSDLTIYQPGDVVRYGGDLYTATTLHSNQQPSISSSSWTLLFQNSKIREVWNNLVAYEPGDIVRHGGNLYLALINSTSQTPDLLDDGSTTNSEYWDLVIPGVRWVGVWEPSLTYVSGDTVTWVSSSYKCIDSHFSTNLNRPDDDSNHIYWGKITDGNSFARLRNLGDIRTFGPAEDGSTIDYTRLAIGETGQALTSINGEAKWDYMMSTEKVYYVSLTGVDAPEAGTSPQSPWRTLRYALERITGYATVFVRTGVYEEVLPLRVPAFVAVVGDELRSTLIKPANNLLTTEYVSIISNAAGYLSDIIDNIVRAEPVGSSDELSPAFGTALYGTVLQDFSGTVGTNLSALVCQNLLDIFKTRLDTTNSVSVAGSNAQTEVVDRLSAVEQITNNREFIKSELTAYTEQFYADSTFVGLPSRWPVDIDRMIDAVLYDLNYVGNYKTIDAANYFINASNGDINKIQNMFLLRDGTGLRNMTLTGLDGVLGSISSAGTRRPTAGAFASLDPGWGPSDTTAWVGSKSPYVQNVTTFGTGCIGLKIDGDLHAGGNQTIVSNDFTQILSDGIGVWANGTGRTEAVSVFTYYNHIGYLATQGGKIRGTNGNCSYGEFGAVSEGFNIGEDPITAAVNNRYYHATVYQALANDQQGVMKLFYSNAGEQYTTATYTVGGSGISADLVADEFRDGAVMEVRITDPGDSSAAGGLGYLFNQNVSQGSLDNLSVILAASDIRTPEEYRQLRIIISSGTGVGQYGYIAEYDTSLFTIYPGKESKPQVSVISTLSSGDFITVISNAHLSVGDPIIFTGEKYGNIQDNTVYYVKTLEGSTQFTISTTDTLISTFGLINGDSEDGDMTVHCVGWEHLVEGTPSATVLDTTSNYTIEPRVTFSSPGFTASSATLPESATWSSVAANSSTYVAVITGSDTAWYSTNGVAWNSSTLPSSSTWSKVVFAGEYFFALDGAGGVARSADGSTWSSVTMSSAADWTSITYGDGKYVAVATGGSDAAYSSNGADWTGATLPGATTTWNFVVFGKGIFVATDLVETGARAANSVDGINWTEAGSGTGTGSGSLAYGNNRFVSLSGNGVADTACSISFDGVNWTTGTIQEQDWTAVAYGQGLFVAVATASNIVATSNDGLHWEYQTVASNTTWQDVVFSNNTQPGKFLAIAGRGAASTTGMFISSGVAAQARVKVVAGRISQFDIWEPGSGYTATPVLSITDPNNTSDVTTVIRLGNGVLGNPTIKNAGVGYTTTTTTVSITGDGYKDEYQLGSFLVVDNLTRIPGPGDNLNISGTNDYTYKVLSVQVLGGIEPTLTARLNIAKDLNRDESPEHGATMEIRQLYSQVRLTGHDFLDIGLGNFLETNYPDTLNPEGTVLAPEDEVRERNGGRVFYTSTDQDGNFRVGELFAVEQATGTVTLNAQFFELQGLEELKLGGVTVGGSGVVIREFSTDETFTADSNNVIPTQAAIKGYLQRRVSGGGADALTGQLVAGIVRVGPDQIDTTTGEELIFNSKVNFKGGVDGTYLAQTVFLGFNL